MTRNVLEINGVDFSDIVEKNSYHTERTPITQSVTTIDGVEHIAIIREVDSLSFKTNPLTQDRYKTLCDQMRNGFCTVRYTHLQVGAVLVEQMKYDAATAGYLADCKYLNKKWVQPGPIQFIQL